MPPARSQQIINSTRRARTVMNQARDSVEGFLEAFDSVRTAHGVTPGATTDQEQDLLRAALVFAAAGLDSTLKELIRETVRKLASVDSGVQRELEVFVERQLRGEGTEVNSVGGRKFLAQILVSSSPQERLIDEYVIELTGSSLQSPDQLVKACKALGIQHDEVGIDPRSLKPVFDARNKIIHELDVNLSPTAARRHQNSRRREDMQNWSEHLLSISEAMIEAVEGKLRESTS